MLVVRDIGKAASWWFAIPSVGPYIKQLTKGRSTVAADDQESKVPGTATVEARGLETVCA